MVASAAFLPIVSCSFVCLTHPASIIALDQGQVRCPKLGGVRKSVERDSAGDRRWPFKLYSALSRAAICSTISRRALPPRVLKRSDFSILLLKSARSVLLRSYVFDRVIKPRPAATALNPNGAIPLQAAISFSLNASICDPRSCNIR